jgi:hypothetical protein
MSGRTRNLGSYDVDVSKAWVARVALVVEVPA